MPSVRRYRRLAAAVYRPEVVHLVIVGEAPPPERFFYFGDSLFVGYLRRAFLPLVPEAETRDIGWFLAFYRALGGWRTDVCDETRRPTKGGADDVSDCLEAFQRHWDALPLAEDPLVVVSPKRLRAALPPDIRERVTAAVPPPGQWNAHRQAFLRDMAALLERYIGRDRLREAAVGVAEDDAALDFEIARACAEGADDAELRRLLRGHPREADLLRAWEEPGEEEGAA
jgi:hypothetical protein